jgi:RNA polymerase sigma-70 factor (ECF subfamily)
MRSVCLLRELEGLSTDECAAVLHVSADVVKQRVHRARTWLRGRLSGYFAKRVQAASKYMNVVEHRILMSPFSYRCI